ncbi:MAG: hypothetical protein ABJF67_16840 [Aurantimonas coralicida]
MNDKDMQTFEELMDTISSLDGLPHRLDCNDLALQDLMIVIHHLSYSAFSVAALKRLAAIQTERAKLRED